MPRAKTNKNQQAAAPAPVVNVLAEIGLDARERLIEGIEYQLRGLEAQAQDLMRVRAELRKPSAEVGTGDSQAQAGPQAVASAKRGRPPGSKNKPKPEGGQGGPGGQGGQGGDKSAPAVPASEAIEATRPEHDAEFAQVG